VLTYANRSTVRRHDDRYDKMAPLKSIIWQVGHGTWHADSCGRFHAPSLDVPQIHACTHSRSC